MGTNLLVIQNVGRQIQGKWIWKHLNFELHPGERCAIVGEAGAGKTLLLRAIAALDPIQSGSIQFQGKGLSDWFVPRYRTQVLYLHQRPALLEGTVEQNLKAVYKLSMYRTLKPYPEQRSRILEYLSILGRSEDFLDLPYHALSGGEAQIAAFLRALLCSPSILLFDEPTASLDARTEQQFESLVRLWQQEDPIRSYFWTSHNPEQLERMTDRRLILKRL
ncbi:MAG: ATP-binding cassette domain-containing protein [Leptolyngbyaceae cyanobacterium CSU_1_3]|nr:ATP-binding cassette domain-containing protein [Leptolyngbyaceae cyanobacterium CSU_1_3]